MLNTKYQNQVENSSKNNKKDIIYQATKKIPKGCVTTYKEISNHTKIKSPRVIGSILSQNNDKNIPCHRVIKSSMDIGQYNKGPFEKYKLLKKEGVLFQNISDKTKNELKKNYHKVKVSRSSIFYFNN